MPLLRRPRHSYPSSKMLRPNLSFPMFRQGVHTHHTRLAATNCHLPLPLTVCHSFYGAVSSLHHRVPPETSCRVWQHEQDFCPFHAPALGLFLAPAPSLVFFWFQVQLLLPGDIVFFTSLQTQDMQQSNRTPSSDSWV